MARITTREALRQHYREASGRAVEKQLDHLDPHCRRFIELSPFLLIGSGGAGRRGDVSPRGEAPGFVHVLDDHRLAIPDRPGNNRLDTMTNILEDPAVGLLFLVPGVDETLRINGRAAIHDDEDLRSRFEVKGRLPATVLVVTVDEAYLHCAKALMRSKLWDPEARVPREALPTIGQMLKDQIGHKEEAEPQSEMVERYKKVLY
jgi:hypothetical protein